jgi:IS5 family transposase
MQEESTPLRFRHQIEQIELVVAMFAEINVVLAEKGLYMKRVSVVDGTRIAEPSSTKSLHKKRDPEMSQTSGTSV